MATSSQQILENAETLVNLTRAKGFLGFEFMSWLWYQCESDAESLTIQLPLADEEAKVALWVDDRIVLSSAVDNHTYTLKGGDPSKSLEATAALKTGKSVKEMKIGLRSEEYGEFLCTLGAEDLQPRGLKVPELEIDEETITESIIEHKIMMSEYFADCLDGLFLKFLSERIEEDWESSGLKEMQGWMTSRTKSIGNKLLH